MDERRKTIGELEARNTAERQSIAALRRELGRSLLSREGDAAPLVTERAEFARLQAGITSLEADIAAVEANVSRLSQVETRISEEKKAYSAKKSALLPLYTRLGKIVLEDEMLSPKSASSGEYVAVRSKLEGSSARLAELEGEKNGNVLKWLGKSAQAAGIKVGMMRDRASLERLHRSAGEEFASSASPDTLTGEEVKAVLEETRAQKASCEESAQTLDTLEKERLAITGTWRTEGSANRKISGYKRFLEGKTSEQNALALSTGERVMDALSTTADAGTYESALTSGDKDKVDKVKEAESRIAEAESQITKLKASLLIDEERARNGAREKRIEELRRRIAESESSIASLTKEIEASDKRIQELMEL